MRFIHSLFLAIALLVAGAVPLSAAAASATYDISTHTLVPNGTPLTQVATTTSEDSVIFTISSKPRVVEMVNSVAWSYYQVTGTSTVLVSVAANQVIDIPLEMTTRVYFKNTTTTGTMSIWVIG